MILIHPNLQTDSVTPKSQSSFLLFFTTIKFHDTSKRTLPMRQNRSHHVPKFQDSYHSTVLNNDIHPWRKRLQQSSGLHIPKSPKHSTSAEITFLFYFVPIKYNRLSCIKWLQFYTNVIQGEISLRLEMR